MYSPREKIENSIVNIGSNQNQRTRARSQLDSFNKKQISSQSLGNFLSDSYEIQFVQNHEDLFRLEENGTALVPMNILVDLMKSYLYNNELLQEQAEQLKEKEKQRLNNNDDCCDCNDCNECNDCAGCCCQDCCQDCECQECGCDCINTIQTNCCDNWQCCQCLQCCTAGDILTELNFNRHIELEDENETFITQFKEMIINYKIYKKFKHKLLNDAYILKKRKNIKTQQPEKIILKTFWFVNQSEYQKQLQIWHQNVFKYSELQVFGSRIQDICIDRWRIAILLPKQHHISKKHQFQFYTFLNQIIHQILQYSEDQSIFDEQLIYYDIQYTLLPSNLLEKQIYQQYQDKNETKHPPEWEDKNETIFDWYKSDCFLIGLFLLQQLVGQQIDDLYENGILNKNKLDFYLQKVSNLEYFNILMPMLLVDPNERYSLQQVLQLIKSKPLTPIKQTIHNQSPLKSGQSQKQPQISILSRVQNQTINTGGVYNGDYLDNKKHGNGKLLNPDGSGYEGEWMQDEMHGKGELFLSDGRILYKGQFQNGKYHGFGHLINPNSSITQNYNFRDLRNIMNYWQKYEGDFKNDKKQGYGILYFTSGEKWAGEFTEDIPNGFGTFFGQSGEVTGKWIKGILFG